MGLLVIERPDIWARLTDLLAGSDDSILRVLVQQAPGGIAIIDDRGCLVLGNTALERMVAGSRNLSPGSHCCDLFSVEDQASVLEAINSVLSAARPSQTFIATLANPTGGALQTVDVVAAALREAGGTTSGAILYIRDISEQVRLTAELAHGRRLQAVGEFTSAIAHDFNNLLMVISSAATDLLGGGRLSADSRVDLLEIKSSSERGVSLVRQLLAFCIDQEPISEVLLLNDVVKDISPLLTRLLGRTITLRMVLSETRLRMRGDAVTLDQVLMNLVVNARNAMPAGGIVTLRTAYAVVADGVAWDGRAVLPGSYAVIEVEDTGTGIPPNVLPRIFDPFFTTRREQGGSGIGLSTVEAIVREGHGFITVASQMGHGTVFRIHLPQDDSADPPVLLGRSANGAGTNSPAPVLCPAEVRAILLVDDEDGLRLLMARALSRAGWHVLAAESGREAIALLQRDPVSLVNLCAIVVDVELPDVSGPALVQTVRQLRPNVPAILCSGYSGQSVQPEPNDNIVFLSKPCSLKTLVALVEQQAWRLGGPD